MLKKYYQVLYTSDSYLVLLLFLLLLLLLLFLLLLLLLLRITHVTTECLIYADASSDIMKLDALPPQPEQHRAA